MFAILTTLLAIQFPLPLGIMNLWHAVPLVVSVSLVWSATRHELMPSILRHAVRFAVWVLAFMGLFMVLLSVMQHLAS
ncbi:MAG: hypothetical protein RH917_03910 [Lacipirellulaceae bacterium]